VQREETGRAEAWTDQTERSFLVTSAKASSVGRRFLGPIHRLREELGFGRLILTRDFSERERKEILARERELMKI
jgi:hypothetical protein